MPFRRAYLEGEPGSNDKLMSPYPNKPSQVPIFILPDISANGHVLRELIKKLRMLGDTRDIFVWYDPHISPDAKRPAKENLSLQEQASLIVECITQDCLSLGPAPYVLVGYSYGCSQAALVAEQLQHNKKHTLLYLIDGVSPECAKQYFSRKSSSLTLDLINIVKYEASLSAISYEYSEDDIVFTPNFIKVLESKSPLECIDEIAKHIITSCKGIDNDVFATNIKIAKQGIYSLINSPDPTSAPTTSIDVIRALITTQTAKKYGDPYGGWIEHAKDFTLVDDCSLAAQDHRELLNQNNAEKVAESLEEFLNDEITLKKMAAWHNEFGLQSYCFNEEAVTNPKTLIQEKSLTLHVKSDPQELMQISQPISSSLFPRYSSPLPSDISQQSIKNKNTSPSESGSLSDNDSEDDKLTPEDYYETFKKTFEGVFPKRRESTRPRKEQTAGEIMNDRFRLFSSQACGNENKNPSQTIAPEQNSLNLLKVSI